MEPISCVINHQPSREDDKALMKGSWSIWTSKICRTRIHIDNYTMVCRHKSKAHGSHKRGRVDHNPGALGSPWKCFGRGAILDPRGHSTKSNHQITIIPDDIHITRNASALPRWQSHSSVCHTSDETPSKKICKLYTIRWYTHIGMYLKECLVTR